MPGNANKGYEFYESQYARFGAAVAAQIRREVYGVDIGQQGWRSMDEQNLIVETLRKYSSKDVIDVACGSGGPSLAIAQETGCKLTGVDVEQNAIATALGLADSLGRSDSTQFVVADCGKQLPFTTASFDAVICIDAILHFENRQNVMSDWFRLLRPDGILIFADAAIVTGAISKAEIDVRASQGIFVCVPSGHNEKMLTETGFRLLNSVDTTKTEADIALNLLQARTRHSTDLMKEEGADWFNNRQKFLEITGYLAKNKKLSRLFYVAQKIEQA
jgi:ubiquinone/menaquinone biosynthesis C-methylase UbiE